jgi:hypothetical protein
MIAVMCRVKRWAAAPVTIVISGRVLRSAAWLEAEASCVVGKSGPNRVEPPALVTVAGCKKRTSRTDARLSMVPVRCLFAGP